MMFPNYQRVTDPQAHDWFERFWGVPLDRVPGLTVVEVMDKALEAALAGRKGPVWLDVPLDLQSALIDPDTLVHAVTGDVTAPAVPNEVVARVADDLRQAQRPVVPMAMVVLVETAEMVFRVFLAMALPAAWVAVAAAPFPGKQALAATAATGALVVLA
jgi:thiamine pyrophosphate-dependent acetolactate synthase large subunit-like protein